MGEAKRKQAKLSPVEKEGLRLTHKLINDGMLIAGGFAAYVMNNKIPLDSPALPQLRDVYMCGAEHVWQSFMTTLDPGAQETPDDMRRLDSIQRELDVWRKQKMDAIATAMPTKGSA